MAVRPPHAQRTQTRKILVVRLDQSLVKAAKMRALHLDTTTAGVLEKALRVWLGKRRVPPKIRDPDLVQFYAKVDVALLIRTKKAAIDLGTTTSGIVRDALTTYLGRTG